MEKARGRCLGTWPISSYSFLSLCWRGLKTRNISWVVVEAVQTLSTEGTKFGLMLPVAALKV